MALEGGGDRSLGGAGGADAANTDPLRDLYRPFLAGSIAGSDPRHDPALLCVDLQGLDASREQGLFHDLSVEEQAYYFERLERLVLPNVQRLQRAFRQAELEVVHVRIQSLTRDGRDRSSAHKRLGILAPPGSREARFLAPVAPRGDEIVLNKTSSGAFDSTRLEYVLRNIGVDSLVIVGVYTNECVSTAARVASDLGFFVTVVEDACATVTPGLQDSSISTLRDRYARILDTDQVARELRERGAEPSGASLPRTGPTGEAASAARAAPRRSVVLLGGGAFASPDEEMTMAGQFDFAERALEALQPLLEQERELLIAHGNGPQVGHMLARVEAALGESYEIPLEVCVAESEGELGYVLQQSLHNVLERRGIGRPVVSVLTQTLVAHDDPSLDRPSKPIGPVYDAERARALEAEGFPMRKQTGGWRRVVPSPEPLEIVEVDVIQALLLTGAVVVAAGGGGVPVVRRPDGSLSGIDAVVDKDLSGALLGSAIGAEELVIVTSVPCVYRDFGSDHQEPIARTTPEELEELAAEGHFEAGTMAPKVEAARRFAASGGSVIICDVDSLERALAGEAGTWVVPPSA